MTEIRATLTYAMDLLDKGLYDRTERMKMRMDACAMPQLYRALSDRIDRSRADADRLFADVARDVRRILTERAYAVERAYGALTASDPKRILERGYVALTLEGRPVRSVRDIGKGDKVKAVLRDGGAELSVDDVWETENNC
jgi:exonuclease VII large subunit